VSQADTLRDLAHEWSDWFTPAEVEALEWAADRVSYLAGTEHVGGVQWCVTHCGLNDETGENHTVRVLVAGAAEGEFDEIVFEDCCDQAAVDENGTFVPCDLRDLVALPKSVAP
jgi:hypothetical protein